MSRRARRAWWRLRTRAAGYVQQNETANDLWVLNVVYPGVRNGYFVEAGACNGISDSSCYGLETLRGWRGLCIEPNEVFYRQLVQNRPASVCEPVCLAASAGTVTYVQGAAHTADAYLGGIEAHLKAFKSKSEAILDGGERMEKPAATLAALLDKHNAPATIDYLCLDIEGSELEVLAGFPFNRYRVRALSLECDGKIWDAVSERLTAQAFVEVTNPYKVGRQWERYWIAGDDSTLLQRTAG